MDPKMEQRLSYLQMIQSVINRFSSNSFLVKGWAITIVTGVFALSAKDANQFYVSLAYFPLLMFWVLDAYFVSQERLYRALYDNARIQSVEKLDFSMDTSPFKEPKNSW